MDPNQCLAELILTARTGDRERFDELVSALSDWLYNGGFAPNADKVFAIINNAD